MFNFDRALLLISTCLTITACGFWGSKRNDAPITPTLIVDYKRGDWFCQVNEAWNNWDCSQDPRLAMKPIPARFPKPPQPEPAPIAAEQLQDALDSPRLDPLPVVADLTNSDSANHEVRTVAPAPQPISAPALERNPRSAALPDWQRFAYRPTEYSALSELPAHFYAVQIVAMSSMEALESFAMEHPLSGALAARVETDGELYYVLLLGFYETLADAQAATASRPGSLMNSEPWIRKLGSLQDAVVRANVLAEPAEN